MKNYAEQQEFILGQITNKYFQRRDFSGCDLRGIDLKGIDLS